jgi:glycosyltransferase involved in cell wall biosynthesis
VEIVGPIFDNDIWAPVADDKSITYKFVEMDGRFKPYLQISKLAKKIDGDVICVSKPLFTSFGIGLLKKVTSKTPKPLILDIDDWEMGFKKESNKKISSFRFIKSLVSSSLFLYSMNSYWNILFMEKLVHFSNEIIVSNTFLREKFGGTIVYHGRDTKTFDPKRFNKNLVREKYGIEKSKKIVMFFGTPKLYKGIEDLIEAVSLIENQDVVLVVVGINASDQYSNTLLITIQETLPDRFKGFGLQSFEMVPKFLVMADIVVVPQRRNFATMGQMPAKVFDAMAMAKPIIASNISDLPEILDGCGWIVEPENPKQLAEKIQYVLNNPEEAKKMGNKARQKCIEKYSCDVMEEILFKVFEKYEQ